MILILCGQWTADFVRGRKNEVVGSPTRSVEDETSLGLTCISGLNPDNVGMVNSPNLAVL